MTVGTRTTLTMAMSTPVFDAFLVVMDDSENLVAWDDDGGGGLNAALEVQLEPGRYFILAQGYPGETGAYQLAVAAANDPCAATRTLALGQSVTNTMAVTDCQFSDGGGPTRFLQRYRLTLPTATSGARSIPGVGLKPASMPASSTSGSVSRTSAPARVVRAPSPPVGAQ